MNLDLVELTTYLTIGLVAYYFLIELTKPKQGMTKWVTWAFVGIVLILIGYWVWSMNSSKTDDSAYVDEPNKINDDPISEDDPIPEDDPTDTPVIFAQEQYEPQKRNFALINGVNSSHEQIKYQDFKMWYLSPEFVNKYHEAVRQALRIKKKKLLETKRKYVNDLKSLQSKDQPKNGFAGLLQTLDKGEDPKMIEKTISEIDSLLKDIQKREKTLTIDSIKRSLVSALTNPKNGIDSLTGREDIKDFLALQLYTFAQNPRIFFSNFQNMAIYGPSGVGKTKLAQVIGHVYASSGILVRNHVHVITKQSLTTAYVNESARLTRKLLLSNLESVVFIDEAYDMTPPKTFLGQGIDHGHEAITEMVNFMDKMMGLSIIIVAGYEKEMEERFMQANQGIPRRFPHKLILKPYKPEELTNILIKFILETCPELKFSQKEANYLYTIIRYINKDEEIFKNQAGDMANLSGFIARAVYGTPGKKWPQDAEEILLSGVNSFLGGKGVSLEELN